ncbi:FxsA cytoplasmic membrane protein [Rhodopirellula maiorica SM1]|uniref:FxsA cytoplasmic membrane protein n=1 Tax=Rhodopirellula maiorica SM1 TaxID=1265738 RepID=M5RXR5_9BACT|nr:FxsA family protein [Rhodopirellula maiorica]EMI20187.1 FxsA cytoplasmic membrane protein [Rhodopirellula maiorica SM1]
MFVRLLAAFIVVPLVELYLLLQLADATSGLTAFAVVIATGVMGSFLARREGANAWFRFQKALAEGRMPSREIQDGLMIVAAAVMLLTPGLLTDALGFLLLVPTGRSLIRRFVLSRYIGSVRVHVAGQQAAGGGTQEDSDLDSPVYTTRRPSSSKTIDATSYHKTHE